MEEKDTPNVIQRAYSFVEDVFGLTHEDGNQTRPIGLEAEFSDSTAQGIRHAAARLDRAEDLVHEALEEIRDVSRGMKERATEETPDYKVGTRTPSESDIKQALQVGEAVNRNEEALSAAGRRVDEVRARRATE